MNAADLKLGDILRYLLLVSESHVDFALAEQHAMARRDGTHSKMIGQLLVELGVVRQDDVDYALKLQARLRNAKECNRALAELTDKAIARLDARHDRILRS